MKKKYIIVTPFFPSYECFRGPYVYDQAKAIQQEGVYEVIVFKPHGGIKAEDDYEYEGIKVHRFNIFELPSAILPGAFDFFSIKSFLNKLKILKIEIADIAIVHTHVTSLGIYANALKRRNPIIKTILQHHGFDVLSLGNGILRNIRLHRKWVQHYGINICNQIDIHVGVSKKIFHYLEAFEKLKIKDRYVLYNGVDQSKFFKEMVSRDDRFTIGCIANFWPLKDHITLLKAIHTIVKSGDQNIYCKFIGTGETRDLCMSFVEQKGLQNFVSFLPELSHSELRCFYNSLDVFVLPSFFEAFGCVYTEAYACGVPFIGVMDQGISEILPDKEKDKWLINKSDDLKLANLIVDYKKNKINQTLNIDISINSIINIFLKYLD